MPLLYIPGRGGGSKSSLAKYLKSFTGDLFVVEMSTALTSMPFDHQVEHIRNIVFERWDSESKIIANSYGCYLLLQALIDMEPFPGKILLLSPVLGTGISKSGMYYSRPPMTKRMQQALDCGALKPPHHLEIYMGSEDAGCCPDQASLFSEKLSAHQCSILKGQGHQLSFEYVESAIARLCV